MIDTIANSDIWESDAAAIVIPVNCVGVMGAGLAKQAKRRYPAFYHAYASACSHRQVVPGKMFVQAHPWHSRDPWLIGFPTKRHWRDVSRLSDITDGLHSLRKIILFNELRSIAIPALGCGLGGLRWEDVKAQIEWVLYDLRDVAVLLYPPLPRMD
jgi:O-acetyl-ADP-ribose deacetylase (regulator of RNase III)